ncbi:CBS domain-containing protein [Nannocystis sp.]|uniref:CBS domain-containing protein n=1 Tax=Nannocystis sp. TaxID=1962667 RepID=UPI0024211F9D|nr:CBS domain-containing protein [Nannocystis sp.]MBK7826642.1 CBS domain-containing protein [Nannocystis sp.]MBK9754262.1 CBS domain-containing protein [Nannocystis sp.]
MTSTTPMPAAADFMSRTVHTLRPEAEISDAVGVLTRYLCSGAPVLDAEGGILGVLTHEGCMQALSGAVFNGEEPGRVADHMAREFAVVEPTADLFRVVSMFSNQCGRRVLVIDGGRVVGIVTRSDTLRALHQLRQPRTSDITIESVALGWSALTP